MLKSFFTWTGSSKDIGILRALGNNKDAQQRFRLMLCEVGVKVLSYRADLTVVTAGVREWLAFCGAEEDLSRQVPIWMSQLASPSKTPVDAKWDVDSTLLKDRLLAFNLQRQAQKEEKKVSNDIWETPKKRFILQAKAHNQSVSLEKQKDLLFVDVNDFNVLLEKKKRLEKAKLGQDQQNQEQIEEEHDGEDGEDSEPEEDEEEMEAEPQNNKRKNAKLGSGSSHLKSAPKRRVSGRVAKKASSKEPVQLVTQEHGTLENFVKPDVIAPLRSFVNLVR